MHEKKTTNLIVDYLSFTIKNEEFFGTYDVNNCEPLDMIYTFKNAFYFGDYPFEERRISGGWAFAFYSSGITFAFGLRDDIYVEMSGSGCRAWESANDGYTWFEFITYLKKVFNSIHFCRLDIACDTFNLISIKKIIAYSDCDDPRFISRFRTNLTIKGNKEKSVYFGSPSSDFRIRIYDKTLERKSVLGDDADVPEDWVRFEFQMRNATSESFIREWLSCNDLSVAYFGILRGHLNFVKKRELNLSRSVVVSWWSDFLGNYEKIKLAYQGGLDYNLQSLNKYVFGQAGKSIKTWLEIYDYDMELFKSAISAKTLNQKQLELVDIEQGHIKEQAVKNAEYVKFQQKDCLSNGEKILMAIGEL